MLDLSFLGAFPDVVSINRINTLVGRSESHAQTKLANLFPGVPRDWALTPEGAGFNMHVPFFRAQKCETIQRNNPNTPNLCTATALETILTVPPTHVVLIDTRSIFEALPLIDYIVVTREQAEVVAGLPSSEYAALDRTNLPKLPQTSPKEEESKTAPEPSKAGPTVIGGIGGAAVGGITFGIPGAVVGAVVGAVIGRAAA